ncbi:leucyl aminopeptidase family protein [Silvanigrella sp.]|jgi:leucyl aminopeptidase|uniref:leucyl aminopeptidase family protein n=1 Tax=Silvanigrella sp. TaxID=2024976 RepID=UPI0037C7D751|nr:leucyl aminopeptidase family protein [Silvanigrellaceae bacterium]
MLLPQLKPLHISHHNSGANLNADLAIIIIDEVDIEKGNIKSAELQKLDSEFGGTISSLISFGDFEGKWLQNSCSIANIQKIAKRVLLLGAGKKQNYTAARARQIGIKSAEISLSAKSQTVAFYSYSSLISTKEQIVQSSLGFNMGMYKYPNSNMKPETIQENEKPIQLHFINSISGCKEALNQAKYIEESINICRLLQDAPPNIGTPKYVSEHIMEKAKKAGLQVEVWGAQKLREKGFHAMLAVAGGSAQEPQFVVVEYTPKNYKKTIAFVGKGLTVDTGGFSIKTPSTSQESMKYDMSGSAVTLSSILAIAKLQLPVRVFAIGALCENMIDAHAYRVGDVLTSYSGKTIEVLNTDAEGRIVLSDALHYAAKDLKPDYIVEFSTLTGAMITTFGHIGAGIFAFDKELEKIVMEASDATGERAYPLPIWDEVADDTKGSISDLANIGNTRGSAGSMVAAAFLNEFVNDIPFVHIDIAGVANDNQSIGYPKKQSAGYGVQLVTEIAKILSK